MGISSELHNTIFSTVTTNVFLRMKNKKFILNVQPTFSMLVQFLHFEKTTNVRIL